MQDGPRRHACQRGRSGWAWKVRRVSWPPVHCPHTHSDMVNLFKTHLSSHCYPNLSARPSVIPREVKGIHCGSALTNQIHHWGGLCSPTFHSHKAGLWGHRPANFTPVHRVPVCKVGSGCNGNRLTVHQIFYPMSLNSYSNSIRHMLLLLFCRGEKRGTEKFILLSHKTYTWQSWDSMPAAGSMGPHFITAVFL